MAKPNIVADEHLSPQAAPVEIVERKGAGHPDTICDALAESLSLALCRYYRKHFGLILHHNVDKALLWGGRSETAFGGGRIVEPMELFLAGRATRDVDGKSVPVEELVEDTVRHWFDTNMHAMDADQVRVHSLIRPGSGELVDLYRRQQQTGVALANDTSCGVGYAPLDELERLVLETERHLNAAETKARCPAIGEDIKIMGVRREGGIALTVACAFIDRYIADMDEYRQSKRQVEELILETAARCTRLPVSVDINTADSEEKEGVYLTVSGTSAEAGDDGEAGRGNRINGLITPYRPMNMEAAAGKNPVTHVGKLYSIVARQAAAAIVEQIPVVEAAQCYLVSRIGHPVDAPQVVDIRLQLQEGAALSRVSGEAQSIMQAHLEGISAIQQDLLEGAISVY